MDKFYDSWGGRRHPKEYSAFGILEQMDLSLKFLIQRMPTWLPFDENHYERTNPPLPHNDEPVREDIISVIRGCNRYDIMLHERATRLLLQPLLQKQEMQ